MYLVQNIVDSIRPEIEHYRNANLPKCTYFTERI